MRVVLDTNVLVSALLTPYGFPARILNAAVAGQFTVLYDDLILGEYRDVLLRPRFQFSPAEVDALLDFFARSGELTYAAPLSVVLPDPSDLPFLEVASAGRADFLVTGNARHFHPRRGRHAVRVVTPAEFVRRLRVGD